MTIIVKKESIHTFLSENMDRMNISTTGTNSEYYGQSCLRPQLLIKKNGVTKLKIWDTVEFQFEDKTHTSIVGNISVVLEYQVEEYDDIHFQLVLKKKTIEEVQVEKPKTALTKIPAPDLRNIEF